MSEASSFIFDIQISYERTFELVFRKDHGIHWSKRFLSEHTRTSRVVFNIVRSVERMSIHNSSKRRRWRSCIHEYDLFGGKKNGTKKERKRGREKERKRETERERKRARIKEKKERREREKAIERDPLNNKRILNSTSKKNTALKRTGPTSSKFHDQKKLDTAPCSHTSHQIVIAEISYFLPSTLLSNWYRRNSRVAFFSFHVV